VGDAVALGQEESFEKVLKNVSPVIADVGIIVNCRTASVEFDLARFKGNEFFQLSTESIIKPDHDELLFKISPGRSIGFLHPRLPIGIEVETRSFLVKG